MTRMVAVAALTALAGEALAESRAARLLGATMPQPGAAFDEVRAMPLPDGQRLVCDTDADKPRLENPELMKPDARHEGPRVRRCLAFEPGADGAWRPGRVPGLTGPARLWLVFVEQGTGGRSRLAQFSLWAKQDGWERTASALGDGLGPAIMATDRLMTWQEDAVETTMFRDAKYPDEFAVSVADIRLRRLLKSPGNTQRLE